MTSDVHSRSDFPAQGVGGQVPVLDHAVHLWVLDTGADGPRAVRTAARSALERLLRQYAGGAPFEIETGRHGKPFAPALPWLDFNLSHAGSHMALAFARNQALGIDIEDCSRKLSVEALSERFFSASEATALARMVPEGRKAAFLQLWTHKEAVLKALGEGLSFGLDRVEFELGENGQAGRLRRIASPAGRADEWQVQRFDPAAGLTGSIAWRGPRRALKLFRLSS
jgi:4'-phosphopantetheinyl transferase